MQITVPRFNPPASTLWALSPFTRDKSLSVGNKLRELRGIAPGFDGVRLYLSLFVVIFHSILVCYGEAYQTEVLGGVFRPLLLSIVPVFFALGGFLVAGSMLRLQSATTFLVFRLFRILPALFCEVMISALILGPIVTNLPLSSYFADPRFADYFFNLIGKIRYVLPGVFEKNVFPDILNAQLWTVPYELKAYLYFTGLIVIGVAGRRWLMLALFVGLMSALAICQESGWLVQDPNDVLSGKILLICFVGGVTAFLWRDSIRLSFPALIMSILVGCAVLMTNHLVAFFPVLVVYVTIFIGMARVPKLPLMNRGDYSYGIYLYGFPIQQAVVHFFEWGKIPVWNLAVSIPTTVVIAVLSWELVEKRILALKRHFVARPGHTSPAEAVFLAALSRLRLGWKPATMRAVPPPSVEP